MKGNRGTTKTAARNIVKRGRMREALAFRLMGLSYPKIGQRLRVNPATAYKYVKQAMQEIPKEEADELRAIETQSLQRLEEECWKALYGQKVTCETCAKVLTVNPDIDAAGTILQVKKRRADMLGLNLQPETLTVEGARILMLGIRSIIEQNVKDGKTLDRIIKGMERLAVGNGPSNETQR